MHYLFFPLLFVVVITGCSSPETPDTTTKTPDPTTKVASPPLPEESTEPTSHEFQQFNGEGNEPGWNIAISHKQEQQYSFELESDYGQVKTSGTLVQVDKTTYQGKTTDDAAVLVTIQQEQCTDDADQAYAYSVQVDWKEQTLRGCGNPVD